MWNSRKSSTLSLILCWIFAIALPVGAVVLPYAANWATDEFYVYGHSKGAILPITICYICCAIFAELAIVFLIKLLISIRRSEVFVYSNAAYLRRISWCCAAASSVVLVFTPIFFSLHYYTVSIAMFAVSICGFFLFLILRVIKNVFRAAIEIKRENDMTI